MREATTAPAFCWKGGEKMKKLEKKYTVKVKETLEELVTVEASSMQEAKHKVETAWANSELVLTDENFQDVTFTIAHERR